MRLPLLVATLTIGACFSPKFQEGVPCSEDRECPEGQFCNADNLCFDEGGGDGDAGVDPNAALSALDVSLGELVPPFDPQTTQYTLDLGLGAEELVVTPTAVDASASILVGEEDVASGSPAAPVALNLGGNTITITVDAGGGAMAIYEIAADRGAALAQRAYVKASNTNADDHFAGAESFIEGNGGIAISGDTIAISALQEDSNATGIGGNEQNNDATEAGAVYVFVRDGTSWIQEAYIKASNTDSIDLFGGSSGSGLGGIAIGLSGDTLVVGAPLEDSTSTGVNNNETNDVANSNSGAAYVFVRDGTTWSQQAYLKASNTDAQDFFGTSVAVDGDTIAIGANAEASSSSGVDGAQDSSGGTQTGAVYVFTRSGTTWTQQAFIKASNPDPQDFFGSTLSLDGDTLAVAALGEASNATGANGTESNNSLDDAGAVYIFQRVGVTWSQQAYLKASNSNAGDRFGYAVDLEGDTLAVSAKAEASAAVGIGGDQANNSAPNAGAVYIFSRSGATWTQEAYVKASNAGEGDRFGASLDLSGDGDGLVVGAPGEGSTATTVGGNEADNSAPFAGAAYLFVRDSSGWSQRKYLKATNAEESDAFGLGVAFSGSAIVVGAPGESSGAIGLDGNQADNSAGDAGAAYIFE